MQIWKNYLIIKKGKKYYKIKLLYLSNYLKDIENNKSIILNENKIPDTLFKRKL